MARRAPAAAAVLGALNLSSIILSDRREGDPARADIAEFSEGLASNGIHTTNDLQRLTVADMRQMGMKLG